ncbi:MAG: hypothetical protein ACREQY_04235, partial [Candidatus Binatia bacterium]
MEVTCRRGSRTYIGPWQVGTDPNEYDRIMPGQVIRFENSDRLNQDVAAGRTTENRRYEWNTATEFYNHFSSHHGVCDESIDSTCMNPENTPPREDFDTTNPDAACGYDYQRGSFPESKCYAEDVDPSCSGDKPEMGGFRNATQVPGRLSVPIPGGRGVRATEDLIWSCNHHVVLQLPPGSYNMPDLADYRKMKGGLTNDTDGWVTGGTNCAGEPIAAGKCIYGADPGEKIGGAVGEMVIQFFTEPADAPVKPVNVMFNALADAATTYYPPFTWNYHESEWTPPFDSALALTAIHSHHRMVKGFMTIAPQNPPRLLSDNRTCGGWLNGGEITPNPEIYTDWYWEDAPVCEYWRDPDGPITLRKGMALRTSCYVNNGVTPEAIKHGLVAGSTVKALKVLGAPIPDYPEIGEAKTWGDPLKESAVGKELLYGTHEPVNYRVVYKCSTNEQL